MTTEETFLCWLYLKTKNDPKNGADAAILLRRCGVPATELRLIVFQLSENGFLKTQRESCDNVSITGKGLQFAQSLLSARKFSVIRFSSAKLLSPTDTACHSIIYYYYLIVPNQAEAIYSITMTATDIVAGTWGISFAAGQPGEQLLLLHARDHIAGKLQRGDLKQHEDVEIRARDLSFLPSYNLDDLVPVSDAEFLVEQLQPEAPTVAEHSADSLGNWILKTRTTINILFKDVYKEDLFLHSDIQNTLDLYKEAATEEAFYTRIASLGTFVGDLNIPVLRKLTNPPDNQVRTISLLSAFIQGLGEYPLSITRPMRNLVTLRNAFPSHKDKRETLDAYRDLGITPPVTNYADTWKILLTVYLKSLDELKELLMQKLRS